MNSSYILIAENDDDLRKTLSEELEKLTGLHPMEAKDGVQAYQKTRNQDFCAIVSDFDLKKLNGVQLVIAARETKHNENTPFIFFTSSLQEAKAGTRGLKGISFFDKSTQMEIIANKIISAIKIDITKKSFNLDVDFINPFIDASLKTLKDLCSLNDIEAQTPYLFESNDLDIDISGTLKISSPYFKGVIALSFKQEVYEQMTHKMLKENSTDIKVEQDDVVAEMINIIFGKTKSVLNNHGYSLERAVPNSKEGHNHMIVDNNKTPILLVPFNCEMGSFWIQICVKAT